MVYLMIIYINIRNRGQEIRTKVDAKIAIQGNCNAK